jgi:multiple sugar transport system substrate-binding protein
MAKMVRKETVSRRRGIASRRHFLRLATTTCGMALLAACAPSAPTPTTPPQAGAGEETPPTVAPQASPITVEWWVAEWNDLVRDWIQKEFVPSFASEHTNITVNPVFVDWGDYLTKLSTSFAGGTAPDLSAGGSSMVPTVATNNQGTVINDLVDEWGEFNDFYPTAQAVVQYKGDIYGLPSDIGVESLLWRKDLFEKAGLEPDKGPIDWDELTDYALQLTERDGDAFDIAGFYLPMSGYGTWHRWVAFLWQAGGDILNEDQTRVIINEQPGVEALQFLADLLTKHKVSPISAIEQAGPPIFTTGMVAMMIGGQDALAEVKQYAPDLYDKVGVLTPPLKKVRPAGAVFPDWVFMTSQTKNPREAFSVLTAFVAPENNVRFNELYGCLPTRKSATAKATYIENDPLMAATQKNIDYGVPWPMVPAFSKIRENLTPMIQEAVTAGKSVKEALDDFAAGIQPLL